MLDDLKRIHELDVKDTLGIAEKEPLQLTVDFAVAGGSFHGIENVVYAGMGGSALAATFIHTWPTVDMPFELVRDYDIPTYVSSKTLFIASSYSGNTEETISALEQAQAHGAQIAVIASGGELERRAATSGLLFVRIPAIDQPRYAVFYSYRALLEILASAGLLPEDYRMLMAQTAAFLQSELTQWLPTVSVRSNPAKQLAQELVGRSVVIYGGPKLFPAAYKWKISCNENAKQVAWAGQLPEFNHNEFIGWSKQPVDKPYAVIDLRSNLEHPRVQKRFTVSERLLSGLRPSPHIIEAKGDTIIDQLLWMILFGDFVSLYLALLNGLNPAPVDLVEKMKVALDA